jgi:hypothetical protein
MRLMTSRSRGPLGELFAGACHEKFKTLKRESAKNDASAIDRGEIHYRLLHQNR